MRTAAALLGALALGFALAPRVEAATEGYLFLDSQPGDYIGGGVQRTFTSETADFITFNNSNTTYVSFQVLTFDQSWWFLEFAAPIGEPLVPGAYEGAARAAFRAPSQPGIDISGDGRGCNTITGRFVVQEIVFGPAGYVERFHVTFEQHCEGGDPALFGEFRVVNPPPPPLLEVGAAVNERGSVNQVSGAATVGGTVTCNRASDVGVQGSLSQRASRFVVISGSFFVTVPCSPDAPAAWSATVTGGGGRPFNPGRAQADVTAFANDPNYGLVVSDRDVATVQLVGQQAP
jgi:hypothetical protein